MSFDINAHLKVFRGFMGERPAPDIVKFSPKNLAGGLKIGFLGLVHGDEVVGLPILNALLEQLHKGLLQSRHEIFFGLGNLPAAHAEKRFLDRDLNRCFGNDLIATPEHRRARELEIHLLDQVDLLIDFHQTVHRTLQPFFIFQYASAHCFNHLALMNPGLTTILQFDAIGGGGDLSTDEYLRDRGRFGAALELGQKGFNQEMFDLGLNIARNFILKLNDFSSFEELEHPLAQLPTHRFFEITERVIAKVDGVELDANAQNFLHFREGQVLGAVGREPFLAEREGVMLFPRLGQKIRRGEGLFHICQPMSRLKLENLAVPAEPGRKGVVNEHFNYRHL